MALSSLLSLTLLLLFVSAPCFAQLRPREQQRFQNECQLDRINAQPPQHRIQSEAGVTEFWDHNDQQFQCAGVAPLRHRIQPRGLLLPSFNNAPQLFYVVQGRAIHGAVFPGCPETYQSRSYSSRREEEEEGRSTSSDPRDQHQKLRRLNKGDVVALPAGTTHWLFNDGDSELVVVSLADLGNFANQLDRNYRKFFLAGNPQAAVVSGGESQRQCEREGRRCSSRSEGQKEDAGNILSGFDTQLLAEALNIDPQLARRLQNRDDMRGAIVRVEKELDVIFPEYQEEEQERRRRGYNVDGENGLEETFCTMRLREQLDRPSRADVFNPRAGRITTVNRFNLPILQYLQLSAERGVLYRNAMYAPHWNMNAHSIVYITRGNGQMQIVREDGETVFNGRVEEGQIITVPQHFAVIKRANEQGLEWVAFKTNSNAKINQVAGRVSTFRALPVDVLSNAFRITREEAWRLKVNRDQEVSIFSPSSRTSSRYAIEA